MLITKVLDFCSISEFSGAPYSEKEETSMKIYLLIFLNFKNVKQKTQMF
jgi:hypothetical protein